MGVERRPIVLIGNTLHELPVGDYLPGLSNALTSDTSYTKTEIDDLLTNIVSDAIDTDSVIQTLDLYSKADMDVLLGLKVDKDSIYIKSEVDTKLGLKADKSEIYTRSQIYTKLETYKKTETYARTETYSKSEVDDKFTNFGALTSNDVYTKIQVDTIINELPLADNTITPAEVDTKVAALKTWTQTAYATKAEILTESYLTSNNYLTQSVADTRYMPTSGTYTRTDIDSKLSSKANIVDIYTKHDIDTLIGSFNPNNYYLKSLTYSRSEVDSFFYQRSSVDSLLTIINNSITVLKGRVTDLEDGTTGSSSDLTNYYTKSDIDYKLSLYTTTATMSATYAIASNVYSISTIDTKLSIKANTADVYTKADTYKKTETYARTETYSKQEIDTKMANIDESLDFSTIATKTDIADALTKVTSEIGTTLDEYNPTENIILDEKPLITISNPTIKVFSLDLNPNFTQVFLNRVVLYKEEYTVSTDGKLTILIDLVKNDKLKVFTLNKQ